MTAAGPPVAGLHTAGGVVVLSGPAARATAQAVLIAIRARRLSGYSTTPLDAIASALVSASGHTDGQPGPVVDSVPVTDIPPTMPVPTAAGELGLSPRQTRRLAPRLGGRKIGGRWLLDPQAVTEHYEGQRNWNETN